MLCKSWWTCFRKKRIYKNRSW